MKLTLFNRTKYESNIRKLETRKAPSYILEAFHRGYIRVINEYYNQRLERARALRSGDNTLLESVRAKTLTVDEIIFLEDMAEDSGLLMLTEASKKKDYDFLKLMYQMTNLDILTGKKRIPANAGQLIKQGEIYDLGLTKLHKKLR